MYQPRERSDLVVVYSKDIWVQVSERSERQNGYRYLIEMSEWTDEWLNEGAFSPWVSEWVSEWTKVSTNEWANELPRGRVAPELSEMREWEKLSQLSTGRPFYTGTQMSLE